MRLNLNPHGFDWVWLKNVVWFTLNYIIWYNVQVLYDLRFRIPGFHPGGSGSTPTVGAVSCVSDMSSLNFCSSIAQFKLDIVYVLYQFDLSIGVSWILKYYINHLLIIVHLACSNVVRFLNQQKRIWRTSSEKETPSRPLWRFCDWTRPKAYQTML